MNRKWIIVLLILWCVSNGILTASSTNKKVVPLSEIAKPINFLSDDSQFYVVEPATVYIYRWDGFRLQKRIGRRGAGPQEYNVSPSGSIRFTLHHDTLTVYTSTKCLFYKKNGSYINEQRLGDEKMEGFSGGFYKLGNFYINNDISPGQTELKDVSFYLCDSKLKKIRELRRARLPIDPFEKKMYIYPQYMGPVFYKEMVFLTVGENLEIIGVNASGKTFLNLKYNYERVKLTEEHITAYHEYFKAEHPDRGRYESRKSWFRFPDFFPAIKNFKVANDQIYVQTYKQNEKNETEFLIFNFKGKYLRTIYLPVVPNNIKSDYLYLIKKNQFVQLVENLNEETWYLHITPMD